MGLDKTIFDLAKADTLFSHSYFRLAASAHGMSASELLSSRLMFPTPLASDKSTGRDAANLDVFLSDNGIFRKRNKDGSIWSLSLSAAVFYLTPMAADGFLSDMKSQTLIRKKCAGSLAAQMAKQELPTSDKTALNPDWVEWLMGFPPKWTDASYGVPSPKASPRMTEDTKDRALRLKTLGNAVCPPQAYPIFHYISLIETGACASICPYGGGDG